MRGRVWCLATWEPHPPSAWHLQSWAQPFVSKGSRLENHYLWRWCLGVGVCLLDKYIMHSQMQVFLAPSFLLYPFIHRSADHCIHLARYMGKFWTYSQVPIFWCNISFHFFRLLVTSSMLRGKGLPTSVIQCPAFKEAMSKLSKFGTSTRRLLEDYLMARVMQQVSFTLSLSLAGRCKIYLWDFMACTEWVCN